MYKPKKLWFSIVIFIVIISYTHIVFALTGEELITDSWFFDEDKIHLNGHDFSIDISDGKTYINYENGYYLLDRDQCTSKEITKICYEDKIYDSSKEEDKVQLKFYTIFPVLSISRTIDENSLSIGDEETISIELENSGLRVAEDILYEEIIPDELEVTYYSEGLELIDNRLRWTGQLELSETKNFNYKIKAKDVGSISYKSYVTYNDGFTEKETSSSNLNLVITNPQTITITSNSSSISIGDNIELDIEISNSESGTIDITSLEIYIPDNFQVIDYDNELTLISTNKFRWSGTLNYNESINIDFDLRAKYDGKQDVVIKGNLTKNSVSTEFEESSTLSIEEKTFIIRTLIITDSDIDPNSASGVITNSDDDKEMESFQEGRFLVYIENPYSSMSLKNILVKIDSPIVTLSGITIDELLPDESKKIIDRTIVAPEVTSQKTFKIKTSAEFKSQYDENYNYLLEEDLSITPIKDITINKDFSSTNPEEGDEVTITVSIKNNREITLYNVHTEESIPNTLKVRGLTSKTTDISSGDEIEVYEYTIKIPFTGNLTKYSLNSTVIYEDDIRKYTIEEVSNLNAKINIPDIDFEKELSDNSGLIGEIIKTTYTIENKDSQIINNLFFRFPYIEKGAYQNNYKYSISQLDASDIISIDDIEKIIFFENKTSISIPKTTIYFEDYFGNKYSEKSNKKSIDIEYASFNQPFLIVDRIVNQSETEKDSIKTKIIIKNIGNKGTDFTIFESGTNTDIDKDKIIYQSYILPDETKEIESIITREDYGIKTIGSAIVEFNIEPHKYYALSPEYEVNFIQINNLENENLSDNNKNINTSNNIDKDTKIDNDNSKIKASLNKTQNITFNDNKNNSYIKLDLTSKDSTTKNANKLTEFVTSILSFIKSLFHLN